MTLNEDRKQTKYGHKRWEHMTHTRQKTDNINVHLKNIIIIIITIIIIIIITIIIVIIMFSIISIYVQKYNGKKIK